MFTPKTLLIAILCTTMACNQSELKNEAQNANWLNFDTPSAHKFSKDSLTQLDTLIQRYVQEQKLPGAVALVAKNGKIVYQTAVGYKDIKNKTPLDTGAIFRLASMTKPIISVAALQLVEKGMLKLDDPVSKFISSFKDIEVLESYNPEDTTWNSRPADKEVTVHHLLTHTSGISSGLLDSVYTPIYHKFKIVTMATTLPATLEKSCSALGDVPLLHDPGADFTYGGSTNVLGHIVEIASGQNLEEYIRENITGPLRMENTRFFYPASDSSQFIPLYMKVQKEDSILSVNLPLENYDFAGYPYKGFKSFYSGTGGMSGTITDYFIFCQAILNGGEYNGVRILQDSTVNLMTQMHTIPSEWDNKYYFGYGFRGTKENYSNKPDEEIISLMWGGAFSTWFDINPKEQTVRIVLSQVIRFGYGYQLWEEFKEELEEQDYSI